MEYIEQFHRCGHCCGKSSHVRYPVVENRSLRVKEECPDANACEHQGGAQHTCMDSRSLTLPLFDALAWNSAVLKVGEAVIVDAYQPPATHDQAFVHQFADNAAALRVNDSFLGQLHQSVLLRF